MAQDHADTEAEDGSERGEQEPHGAVDAIPAYALASPPRMAPLRPPIIPRIPIKSKLAATVVLDATVTHRAGCAATAVEMIVLSLGGEHQRAHDCCEDGGEPCEKMNVKPTVNGRSVSGSILTKVARIHDSTATPMTGVSARIVTFERSDDTLIHSLCSAVGIEAVSSRRDRWRTRTVVDAFATEADAVGWVVMVMEMGSFLRRGSDMGRGGWCGGSDALGGSDRGELGDKEQRSLEQDLFEGARGLGDLDDPNLMIEREPATPSPWSRRESTVGRGRCRTRCPHAAETARARPPGAVRTTTVERHAGERAGNGFSGEELSPADDAQVVGEHLEFTDQVTRHEHRAARSAKALSEFRNQRMPSGSRPLDGSSSNSTLGSPSRAPARARRWRMPSEKLPARWSAALSSPTFAEDLVDSIRGNRTERCGRPEMVPGCPAGVHAACIEHRADDACGPQKISVYGTP